MQDATDDSPSPYGDPGQVSPYGYQPMEPAPVDPEPGAVAVRAYRAKHGLDYPVSRNSGSSDNEFVNIVRTLTEPEIGSTLDHFLLHNPLTPNAIHRLKTFYKAALDATIVGGYLRDSRDFDRLWDTYQILKCETPLDLTCYDVNAGYNHILNIIDLHFQNALLKARGGKTLNRVLTSTQENISIDGNNNGGMAAQEPGLLNRMRMR